MTERLLALAVLLASGAYLVSALPLPMGTEARPGPGFFPVVVGTFACGAALAFVVLAFRGGGAARPVEAGAPGGAGRVLATSAALVGFGLVLPWAGYPVMAAVFVTTVLRRLGAGWAGAVTTGIAAAAGSHYLFAHLLGVPLPRGVWLD